LIPDPIEYQSILSAFQKREPEPNWRERLAARLFFWREKKDPAA